MRNDVVTAIRQFAGKDPADRMDDNRDRFVNSISHTHKKISYARTASLSKHQSHYTMVSHRLFIVRAGWE